jgi:fermentation-respiration switch protein FrsA (DUF1100 family)
VDARRIGGIGLSVGGELMLQTAAHTPELRAVVSEGAGIRSVREQQESDGSKRWLEFPTWAMTTAATTVFANRGPPPNLKDLMGRISPRPVFLIHAERGQGGEDLNPEYFAAAGPPRTIWKTDSGHTGGIEAAPREYERRVVAFFDRYLRAERVTASHAAP